MAVLFGGRTFAAVVSYHYFRLPDFSNSEKIMGYLDLHKAGTFSRCNI